MIPWAPASRARLIMYSSALGTRMMGEAPDALIALVSCGSAGCAGKCNDLGQSGEEDRQKGSLLIGVSASESPS